MATELQFIRESKGYSQRELAELSGVPQSTISKMEKGQSRGHPRSRVKIAQALGIEITDITEFIPQITKNLGELEAA